MTSCQAPFLFFSSTIRAFHIRGFPPSLLPTTPHVNSTSRQPSFSIYSPLFALVQGTIPSSIFSYLHITMLFKDRTSLLLSLFFHFVRVGQFFLPRNRGRLEIRSLLLDRISRCHIGVYIEFLRDRGSSGSHAFRGCRIEVASIFVYLRRFFLHLSAKTRTRYRCHAREGETRRCVSSVMMVLGIE